MNWFLVIFSVGLVVTNIILYKLHHRKIGLYEGNTKDRSTYTMSLPTRLFAQGKYVVYLVGITHAIANPLWLNPGSPGPFRLVAGTLMGIVAVLLLYASLKALGANYAPNHIGVLPKELVKSGPYRFFSHPIYLANVLMYLGMGVLSFGYLIVVALLISGCSYYYSIRDENKALSAHFTKV